MCMKSHFALLDVFSHQAQHACPPAHTDTHKLATLQDSVQWAISLNDGCIQHYIESDDRLQLQYKYINVCLKADK